MEVGTAVAVDEAVAVAQNRKICRAEEEIRIQQWV